MGREIKFRAKVLNSNNWIYRQPFHIRGTWYMYNSLWDMVPIEHKTIGQYTGLKDCDGQELYEGDICELRTGYGMYGTKGVVGFEKGEFYFTNLDEGLFGEFKIIGNIYENPELLASN
jgi:uncharacterized phage protein (TIGR01671 family)